MKLEDVDEARASWMKLDMVCIQLCQGAVSAWCTDKPCIVDSVPDHMVVVAFQKLAAFIPVVVQEPHEGILFFIEWRKHSRSSNHSLEALYPRPTSRSSG